MNSDVLAQLSLEDQVALRLGRMAMRFAILERITRDHLVDLLDLHEDDVGRVDAVVGSLPFRKLRDSLRAIAHERFGDAPASDQLKALLGRAAKLEERRNALTHSAWDYSQLPSAISREKRHISASGKIRTDVEAFEDIAALDSFVAEIDVTASQLYFWYMEHFLGIKPPAG